MFRARKCPGMPGFFDIFSGIWDGGGSDQSSRRKNLDGFGHGKCVLLGRGMNSREFPIFGVIFREFVEAFSVASQNYF